MDLSDLEIFRAVVHEGGILKAARKLHRVQSNVTKRVQQLEAALGAQLFFRNKQRLFLSPTGEMLLSYADRLLRLADEARAVVSGAPPRGVLRLGSLESTSASRLPGVLASFHRLYPEVRVELTSGTNDALTAAVAGRQLDAAFVAEPPASAELSHLPVFAERLVLITSLDHRPVRRPGDIAGDSLIAFPSGCAYRRVLESWIGDRGLASARVLNLASYHAIVACVASGTGVAVVPESVLDTVRSSLVARYPLPKVLGQVVTPFIWRSAEQQPAVVGLRELLLKRVARNAPGRAIR
ncbi:MAG TPA: LysR family transcriptional regulator [Burkholderiaceae bacterium]|nr:LysR family transcriptional regulator [Burkholderiaceae bacterium]